jgi:hypothetical protein
MNKEQVRAESHREGLKPKTLCSEVNSAVGQVAVMKDTYRLT